MQTTVESSAAEKQDSADAEIEREMQDDEQNEEQDARSLAALIVKAANAYKDSKSTAGNKRKRDKAVETPPPRRTPRNRGGS